MKLIIQTLMYPIVWVWWLLSDTSGGIWMPEFPHNTEKHIWNFVQKYGYKLDDSTYRFCEVIYYHDIKAERDK